MRFNDIVLPSSPRMRQRSASPTKMQSEGNLSPWRIRVTVEAEQEDDELTQDGPRKRLKPSTTTTKVPLKDEESNPPSAKKRRGRPRKSDVREQNTIPIKGSPGRTPKLQAPESTKRPRGRPRKSLQIEEVAQSIEATANSTTNDNTRVDTFDGALDRESPAPFMTADIGPPSDASSEPDPFLDMAGTGAFESPQRVTPDRSPPRVVSNMPDPESKNPARVVEGTQQTTPRGTASPPRKVRGISPEYTLHAGHTPRVRRSYPTPTSSSLVDENGGKSTIPVQQSNGVSIFSDPTDVHHEYDTIMESEDFSMVSLDTLPSAKQAGLSSILSSAKGTLQPFAERQNAVSFDKSKARVSKSPRETANHTTVSSMSTPRSKSVQRRSSYASSIDQVVPVVLNTATTNIAIPEAPEPPTVGKEKKFLSLARLVRLGLSLHGAMHYEHSQDMEDSDEEIEEIANARDRLEGLFDDFDAESQRQLRAGLRFGELVARGKMETRRLQREEEKESILGRESYDSLEDENDVDEEPNESLLRQKSYLETSVERQLSKSQQAEAEWQRERERVSRQIDEAGSENVIVLESEEDAPLQSESDTHEEISDVASEAEDDDFGDVWQEEARNHDSSFDRHRTLKASQSEKRSDASKYAEQGGRQTDYTQRAQSYDWDPSRGEIPPLGRSRMAQIREEEVDLSLLLKPRDTPKSRQYYSNSSPYTALSQASRSNRSLKHGVIRDASSPAQRSLLHSNRVSREREEALSSDIVEHNEVYQEDSMAEEEDEEEREDEQDEEDEVQEEEEEEEEEEDVFIQDGPEPIQDEPSSFHHSVAATSTPEHSPKQSWFRRITNNFTPDWWTTSKKEHINATDMPLDESQSPPFKADSSERHSSVGEEMPSLKRSRSSRDFEEEEEEEEEEAEEMKQPSPVYNAQPRSKKQRASYSSVLALSGYFTDAHYVGLKRLYQQAKRFPERFPYYSTERREEMLGDTLWTSDGERGLPITKIQFGILDRFVSDLMRADIRNGGRGEIGWTEDDLHKRLFSIIVGEEIRRERKELDLMV
jgi:hypothetical protein